MKERLQKYLARAGTGSRRGCETLIAEGRVKVNGVVVAKPGHQVDTVLDEVFLDDRPVVTERPVYLILHKPKGFVCSNRQQGDTPRVIDLVKARGGERLFCVGRLDEESQGAILLTNDGDFSNLITHPRYGVEKTYLVSVKGRAEPEHLAAAREGVYLAEGRTAPAHIHVIKRDRERSTLKVTLREGRNRHIRRVFAQIGLPVREITRVQIGSLLLGRLKPREYRELSPKEVRDLIEDAKSAAGSRPRAPARRRGAVSAASLRGERADDERGKPTRPSRARAERPADRGRAASSRPDRSGRAREEGPRSRRPNDRRP